MSNLLESWLKSKGLTCAQASRALKCSPASMHAWSHSKSIPSKSYAWEIHKMTRGEIPITHWGYEVRSRKIKRKRVE